MGRIIRSPEAQSDVDEIALQIARDSLDAALRWLESVDECLKLLARHPGAGPARDELAAGCEASRWGITSSSIGRQRGASRSCACCTGRAISDGSFGDGVLSEPPEYVIRYDGTRRALKWPPNTPDTSLSTERFCQASRRR